MIECGKNRCDDKKAHLIKRKVAMKGAKKSVRMTGCSFRGFLFHREIPEELPVKQKGIVRLRCALA